MNKLKVIRCKNIYQVSNKTIIDGYVIVDGNRIKYVLNTSDGNTWLSSHKDLDVLNYSPYFLMPGFNDYHVHLFISAIMEYYGTVRYAASEDEAAALMYEYNKDKITDDWILGGIWDHFLWPHQKLPTKASLDQFFQNTPVFLLNKECHGAWLNSEALRRFNITKKTPDPSNGRIYRDENGEPTGYIHEAAVAPLIERIINNFSDETISEFTKTFVKIAHRNGVTSVGDLALYGIMRLGAYRSLLKKNDLRLRIHFSLGMMEPVDMIKSLMKEFSGPIVRCNGTKDFLDGTPMGYTGYLIEPYENRPGFVSQPMIQKDVLFAKIIELDRANIRTRIHCCGDGAVRLALDAYENAKKINGPNDLRHAIEHIEFSNPRDISRFASLGVIASVQGEHPPRTHYAQHPFHYLIGKERMRYMWPFKSLINAGARLAFGTDYPVVEFSPFKGLFRSVNRVTNELEPIGGYNPEEKLSLHEAIEAYTYGSAYACGRESELGTIEEGKLADLVVLERNPFECIHDIDAMFNMRVIMTMFDGKLVYQSEEINNE